MTIRARAALVRHLNNAIQTRGLTNTQAAALLRVPEETIHALQQGNIEAFTLAELEAIAQVEVPPEAIPAEHQYLQFGRLEPVTGWSGGRITDIDVLPLEEAARMATKHAGQEVTPADFLRAAGRGEITLHAVVHRTARVRARDGGVYCNRGQPNENIVPAGCIAILPLTACKHLADAGRASWRTFDGRGEIEGVPVRYAKGMLDDAEPDFETLPTDCRVTGYNVRALADAFIDEPTTLQPQAATPAPVVAECANDAPVDGITTAQVAAIFDGIKYRAENWTRRLSDTKWLEPAKVALGAQGGASSLWNPATLARLIHGKERGTAKQKTLEALNRKFKSKPVLAPWRTAWDEHYDMFKDADGRH